MGRSRSGRLCTSASLERVELVGKWMSVKSEGAADTVIIQTKGDWIKTYSPDYKETVEGKMDGSHLPVTGPIVPPGVFQTIKPEGPNKLHYTTNYNDKVLNERRADAERRWQNSHG